MHIDKRESTFCEEIERESVNPIKFIPLPLPLIFHFVQLFPVPIT